jgi:hypothetical protein
MIRECICELAIVVLAASTIVTAQSQNSGAPGHTAPAERTVNNLFNYLNMAGTEKASGFRPLTQDERTKIFLKTMVNPFGYIKAGMSAGIDQWNDKPDEWGQGASAYGKRYANIIGQYSIQRSATFGLSSVLHEDNRYFNSGKSGFWPRTKYALASGILARHDDGSRHISISQPGGVAAGAFISRTWLPPSQNSAGDAATSFGITMAGNIGFGVVKEFLPDIGRAVANKRKRTPTRSEK